MTRVRSLLTLLATFTLLALTAWGQATTGSVFGTVTDTSGAAVPNAKVTLRDTLKGTVFTTTTNASGNYTIIHLIPDPYQLTVEKSGFEKFTQSNVTVVADQGLKVDAAMHVGAVSQTVEVTSAPPLLKTDRADVATVLDTRQIEDTPVANRNFTDLELLMPGTVMLGWQHASSENPQRSAQIEVNGQGFFGTDYILDGTDNRDPILGIIVINPDPDSIQEVKMTTDNFDAEFGTATAAVMTAQTKSGTNTLHGEGFDYIQNDKLMVARDPFSQSVPNPITGKFNNPLRYNQFGGNIGGAIIKRKLFFFGDYEGLIRHRTANNVTFVPTAAERAGDFSGQLGKYLCQSGNSFATPCANNGDTPITVTDTSGLPQQAREGMIFDPTTGTPDGKGREQFAGNIIPAGRIDSVAGKILGMLPAPNYVAPGNNTSQDYLATGQEIFDSNSFDTREDWNISENSQFFARYSFAQYHKTAPGDFGTDLGGPALDGVNFAGVSSSRDQSLALGFNHTFSPTLLTEVRYGYARYRVNVDMGGAGKDLGAQAGIGGVNLGDYFTSGFPSFQIDGNGAVGVGTTTLGYAVHNIANNNQCNCPLRELEFQHQFVNNWTKFVGNHQFKWGADVRFANNLRVPSDNSRNGQFFYHTDPTSAFGITNSGDGVASFDLGITSQFMRYVSTTTNAHELQNRYFLYAQDTYRATPSLTLSYGLRWEFYQPQRVNGPNLGGWFDFTNANIIAAGVGPYNLSGNVQAAYKNFAPRLGVAWQMDNKTVVRVGYGRSFDIGVFGTLFGHTVTQNLPVLAFQDVEPTNTFQGLNFTLTQGPPSGLALFPNPSSYSSTGEFPLPNGVNVHADERKEVVPYVDQWNLSVQRQLSSTMALDLAYVGNKGTHIGATPNINAPTSIPSITDTTGGLYLSPYFQKFGLTQGITDYCNCDSNNYNALQIKLSKQYSNGLQIFANYAWAHSMGFNDNWVYGWRYGYGTSGIDIRQVFNLVHNYDLPIGRGKKYLSNASGWMNALVGGWTFNGDTSIHSGLATTAGYSGAGCKNCPFQTWPDKVGDPYSGNGAGSQQTFWNRAAFKDVPPSTSTGIQRQGTACLNCLTGPAFWTSNLSLFKSFQVSERAKLQVRIEAFNAFNHDNWAVPDSNIDDPQFGQVTGTQIFAPDLNAMRTGEVALKLSW